MKPAAKEYVVFRGVQNCQFYKKKRLYMASKHIKILTEFSNDENLGRRAIISEMQDNRMKRQLTKHVHTACKWGKNPWIPAPMALIHEWIDRGTNNKEEKHTRQIFHCQIIILLSLIPCIWLTISEPQHRYLSTSINLETKVKSVTKLTFLY